MDFSKDIGVSAELGMVVSFGGCEDFGVVLRTPASEDCFDCFNREKSRDGFRNSDDDLVFFGGARFVCCTVF